LGDEGQVPRRRLEMRTAGFDAATRRHEAEAVGSDDAQAMRARGSEHRLLQTLALAMSALAEAGRHDDRRAATAGAQLGDHARHGGWRCGDYGEIRNSREVGQRAIVWPRPNGA